MTIAPSQHQQEESSEPRLRSYEILVILSGSLSDEEAQGKADELKTMISQWGTNVESRPPMRSRFAYPIDHQQQGVYCVFEATSPVTVINELSEKMKRVPTVLRHQITYAMPKKAVSKPRQRMIMPQQQPEPAKAMDQQSSSHAPAPVRSTPLEEKDLDKTIKDILDEKLI